jgi:hypothetical protein
MGVLGTLKPICWTMSARSCIDMIGIVACWWCSCFGWRITSIEGLKARSRSGGAPAVFQLHQNEFDEGRWDRKVRSSFPMDLERKE